MGQYYKLINTQKKEFVCPWCVGGGAKLWEWAASPHGALLTLLQQRNADSEETSVIEDLRLVKSNEAITAPFPNVAVNIIQPERVACLRTDVVSLAL